MSNYFARQLFVEDSATASEKSFVFRCYNVEFHNDGSDDIYVSFRTQYPVTLTIKPGEAYSAPLVCSEITVRAKSDSQPFRVIGLTDPT